MIEVVAAAYSWPPDTIDALGLDDLAWWSAAAVRKLRSQA